MRRIDALKQQAAALGISNERAKSFGSLSRTATWEAVIAAHSPSPTQPKQLTGVNRLQLQPPKILCPTCLARHADICYRCEGSGQIFNLVRFRAGYAGSSRLPVGCL
ncbi:MAG: hypothetical protein ACM37W_26935 [Actinomycetota bacterium]